ncbi:hypothetical protein [Paractinoplanes globisporus]|uniref:Lipoprotein n=1 Tax=Paractinoplanes globisporus TaxID=113565 RepID=A0ABW6WVG0_9ACTN|nr:hypothetical protein [Actinoplanes globisporus]
MKSIAASAVAFLAVGGLLAGCNSKDDVAPAATQAAAPTSAAPADNGVAALTADQILAKSKAALTSAKSFRVKGSTDADGQKMQLDLEINGTDVLGKIAVGKAVIELLAAGGKHYIRPNQAFWTTMGGASAADAKNIANLMGKRWVVVSAKNKDLNSFFDIVNIDEMLKPQGTASKGTAKQIGEYKTIGLKDSEGGTLYVATVGEPYPIQEHDSDGDINFTEFGKTFTDLKAPAAADVVDLNL